MRQGTYRQKVMGSIRKPLSATSGALSVFLMTKLYTRDANSELTVLLTRHGARVLVQRTRARLRLTARVSVNPDWKPTAHANILFEILICTYIFIIHDFIHKVLTL